jgi:hypothetical protein
MDNRRIYMLLEILTSIHSMWHLAISHQIPRSLKNPKQILQNLQLKRLREKPLQQPENT